MAKREPKVSIVGLWKKIQKHMPILLNGDDDEKRDASERELKSYLTKINDSYVPGSISQNFIAPYLDDESVSVRFELMPDAPDSSVPIPAILDAEKNAMIIDATRLFRYSDAFLNAGEKLEEMKANGISDFKLSRQLTFMREIVKLPTPYLLYISVLQAIAYKIEVVSVEDKEGVLHESDAGFYLTLLWALKEFESFYLKTQNRHMRADYGIIWHEGEWIEDDTKGRGYS